MSTKDTSYTRMTIKIAGFIAGSLVLLFFINGCKKQNYIIGGTPTNVNQYENITTYEYLQNNPIFDTLVQLINAAGLEGAVNAQGTTFFASTNYSVFQYLNLKTIYLQNTVNQNEQFGLDSLLYYVKNNINGTADSLEMYLINQPLTYNVLTNIGAKYSTELQGDTAIVSYQFATSTSLGYNPIVSTVPQVVYYAYLWTPNYPLSSDSTASMIPGNEGFNELVQTSGIYTKNGVVEVLTNQNVLFGFGQQTN